MSLFKKDIIIGTILVFMLVLNVLIASILNFNVYLSMAVSIILIFYLLLTTKIKMQDLAFSCLYITLFTVSVLFSQNIQMSLMNFIIFLLFICYVCFFKNINIDKHIILKSIAIGIIFSSFRIVFLNFDIIINPANISIHERFDAYFIGGINNMSYLTTLAIIILYYENFKKNTKRVLIIYLIIFNLLTLSRGGNIAMLLFFLYISLKKNTIKRLAYIVFVFLVISLSIYNWFPDVYELLINRFDISTDTSGAGRTQIWLATLSSINDAKGLLLGAGPGTFRYMTNMHTATSVHNQFFDILYGNGIIFLTIVFFQIIYLLNITLKNKDSYILAMNGLYLFSFIFDTRLWVVQTFWVYAIIIGLTLKQKNEKKHIYNNY